MTFLLTACTAPVTNITGPLYHLIRESLMQESAEMFEKRCEEGRQQTTNLFLAIFRTITVAALFFTIIPCHNPLCVSLSFVAQFLVHPYAASLFQAFVGGGYTLILKVMDIFAKRALVLTTDDIEDFASAIVFCYIAQLINHPYNEAFLDRHYRQWSEAIANRFFPKNQKKINELKT